VIGIIGDYKLHLVESDVRKCVFLKEVSRLVKRDIHIHNQRIENIDVWESDVLTARALASVDKLLNITKDFRNKSKISLFLKGQNVVEEIEEAKKNWCFEYEKYQSSSNISGCILKITNLK
jgi:16S rRNA (guanine527-N7)-methyltransferase